MKHVFQAIKKVIDETEDEKEKQKDIIAEQKKKIDKTKEKIVNQNVRLEKFEAIIEEIADEIEDE